MEDQESACWDEGIGCTDEVAAARRRGRPDWPASGVDGTGATDTQQECSGSSGADCEGSAGIAAHTRLISFQVVGVQLDSSPANEG